jgi:hypothetical protein
VHQSEIGQGAAILNKGKQQPQDFLEDSQKLHIAPAPALHTAAHASFFT